MIDIEIVPATRSGLLAFRADHRIPASGRAVMAIDPGGNVLGAGGVWHYGAYLIPWLELGPEICKHPRWVVRNMEAVLGLARGRGLPIVAFLIDPTPGPERLLKFAGFEPMPNIEGGWILPEKDHV